MFEKQKQIGGYRLQLTEHLVIIDERSGFISSLFDVIWGLLFMSPLCFLASLFLSKNGVFGIFRIIWHIPISHWLIILPLLCVPLVFFYYGFCWSFVRSHIEAADENILTGNTWFGVPLKLKTTPISEISSVQLKWKLSGGMFTWPWNCDVSALPVKAAKPIQLFSCSTREVALELANAVAEITKLPVQEIPQS